MSAKKVLVVDDEASIREMLRLALEISDFECLEAADIHEAYRLITDESPDMVLLDWMLPGGSGIELLRRLKKEEATQALPVIMLTAKTHEDNVVQGLEVGADDYITKDVSIAQLLARVAALLRRVEALRTPVEAGQVLERGRTVVDQDRMQVSYDGQVVALTITEFWLLYSLVRYPGHVKNRDQLMQDAGVVVDDGTITSHVKRIRKKFQLVAADFDCIETVYGAGYRWVCDS